MNTILNISYISDTFFEREKRIWRTAWLVAGRESDLDETGKFIKLDLSAINVSVFIMRESNGKLNALYNICPHRNGRLVCDPQGKKAAITCSYHGWSFQLDGKLRGIPEQQLFPNINKNDYSLVPVSVDTWGGFVFVNLGSNPEYTLKEYMCGLPSGLATRNALTEDWPTVEGAHENMRTGLIRKSIIESDMEATVSSHYGKLLRHLDLSDDELQDEKA